MFSILIIINGEAVLPPQGHIYSRCIISEKCNSQLKFHMLLLLSHRPCTLMVYLDHFLPFFFFYFFSFVYFTSMSAEIAQITILHL